MGFFDKIGNTVNVALRNGVMSGAAGSILNKYKQYTTTDSTDYVSDQTFDRVITSGLQSFTRYGNAHDSLIPLNWNLRDTSVDRNIGLVNAMNKMARTADTDDKDSADFAKFVQPRGTNEDSDNVRFRLPDWGYTDFINERSMFQKGLTSPFNDPGWFYFKIFFNFDTQYGLFGGILNNEIPWSGTSSAARYMRALQKSGKGDDVYHMEGRLNSLIKFVRLLSYINTDTPWFFKTIKNINQADTIMPDSYTQEKYIEIEFAPDATDMRLTTLNTLYRTAVYDNVYGREALPDNLRKFNMSVMVFEAPLKWYHTAYKPVDGTVMRAKTMRANYVEFENVMSLKMYTFVGCEINKESLTTGVSELSNEQPYKLEGMTWKINYDRCYVHNMNEFFGTMFGDDGFYYNKYNVFQTASSANDSTMQADRYDNIRSMYDAATRAYNSVKSSSGDKIRQLTDMSEAVCHINFERIGGDALGNIYGENKRLRKNWDDYQNYTGLDTGEASKYVPNTNTSNATLTSEDLNDYPKAKMKYIHNRVNGLGETGLSILSEWLGSNYNKSLGNLYDHNYGTTTASGYFEDGRYVNKGNYNMGLSGPAENRVMSDYLKDKLATIHGYPDKYQNTEYDKLKNKKSLTPTVLANSPTNLSNIRTSETDTIGNNSGVTKMTSVDSEYFRNKIARLHTGQSSD